MEKTANTLERRLDNMALAAAKTKPPRAKPPPKLNRVSMLQPYAEKIDAESARFLAQSTNLFSDYDAKLVQPPDEYAGRSIMIPWSYDIDVSMTANQTLGVFSLPLTEWSNFRTIVDNSTAKVGSTGQSTYFQTSDSVTVPLGPINVVVADAGENILASTSDYAPTSTYFNTFVASLPASTRPASWQVGRYRLVAAAYEAINTSAAQNLTGTVTVGRYSQVPQLDSVGIAVAYSASGTAIPTLANNADMCINTPCQRGTLPPVNLGELLYVDPNAATWPASRGFYVNIPVDHETNAPAYGDSQMTMFASESVQGVTIGGVGYATALQTGFTQLALVEEPRFASAGGTNTYDPCTTPRIGRAPLHGVSTFVTSVNAAQSFRLRFKLLYEVFGTPGDSLATLCQPRPKCREDVIELCLRVLRELPVGCPQDLNPEGEWWQGVLSAINKFLPAAASVLAAVAPELAPLGAAAVFAGDALQSVIDFDRRQAMVRAYGKR